MSLSVRAADGSLMRTSLPPRKPGAAVIGVLVLDRRGRVQDADPAVRDVIRDRALRLALLETARKVRAGEDWSHHVVRVGATTLRAQMQREAETGRFYALIGVEERPRPLDLSCLSPREREVALLVGGRRSDARVARRLGMSASTVRWHLTNIFRKTGLVSREDVQKAVAAGPSPGAHARPDTT